MDEPIQQKEKLIDEEIADVSTVSDQPLEISDEAKQSEAELEKIAPIDSNQVLKTRSPSKKILTALIFIAVNLLAILLTVVMEFSSEEQPVPFSSVWTTFSENFGWVICGILMFVCSLLCDATKRYILLKSTLNKKMPLTCIKAVIVRRYYDNITPLGSGGQPFEIYYMRKKGVPVGIASGEPIVCYALERIAYVFIAFITLIIYGFGETSTFIKILCIIGLIVNAFIPFAIFFFTTMPKVAKSVSSFVAKAAKKFHLTKDADAFEHKITGSITEYSNCLKYFMQKSKIGMLKSFLLDCLQFLAFYSIPFFAVRMSGNYTASWGETFALCVICYTSVTLLPTPGNSGGAELSFRSIFASYLSGGLLFWGMLSWRMISYYSYIIVGLILILGQQIKKIIVVKRHPEKADSLDKPLVEEPKIQPPQEQDDDDESSYVLPKKAISGTENIESAEHVIKTVATIDEQEPIIDETVTPPVDAEQIINVEVVIEKSDTAVIVEQTNEQGEVTNDEQSDEPKEVESVKQSEVISNEQNNEQSEVESVKQSDETNIV